MAINELTSTPVVAWPSSYKYINVLLDQKKLLYINSLLCEPAHHYLTNNQRKENVLSFNGNYVAVADVAGLISTFLLKSSSQMKVGIEETIKSYIHPNASNRKSVGK